MPASLLVLGTLYGLIATCLIIAAALAVHDSKTHGGEWAGIGILFGLIAGGIGLVAGISSFAFFMTASRVRRGSRRACSFGKNFCLAIALLPPLPFIAIAAGNDPSIEMIAGCVIGLSLWAGIHLPAVFSLRKICRALMETP
jgi:hypothetical protein